MVWLMAMIGCDGSEPTTATEATSSVQFQEPATPQEALRGVVESWANYPNGGSGDIMLAHARMFYLHRDEILKTLEIVETLEEGPFAYVMYRYSVGATICRDAHSFMQVEGSWFLVNIPYFSERTPLEADVFRTHQDFLAQAQDKASQWTEKQSACWWE